MSKNKSIELPEVAGRMIEGTLANFKRSAKLRIKEEQEKISPDNALIAVLCDAVRLAREYKDNWDKSVEDLGGRYENLSLMARLNQENQNLHYQLTKLKHFRDLWKQAAKVQFKEAKLCDQYWAEARNKHWRFVTKLAEALDIPCIGTDYGVSFNDTQELLEVLVNPLKKKFEARLKQLKKDLKKCRMRRGS